MKRLTYLRRVQLLAFAVGLLFVLQSAYGQPSSAVPKITDKQARDASDAYIVGAKQLLGNNPAEAEESFSRAITLDPTKQEYAMALAVAKQHHVTQLVQDGAKQRLLNHNAEADKLFQQAQAIDPDNEIVAEHLQQPSIAVPFYEKAPVPVGAEDIARLGGPIRLIPADGTKSFHTRGDVQSMLREVYNAFGIQVTFDDSLTPQPARLDLDDVGFDDATRIARMVAHVFATPLSGTSVLLAKESPENRDRLSAKIEETVYLPGLPIDQVNELSNVAKNVFDIKQATVTQSGQALLLRGNDDALQLVNTTFASLLDGGDDVMLDVKLYEVDSTFTRNLGAALPTSIGAFAFPALASQLVAANQSLIQQAVSAGLLDVTTGSYYQILARELIFLIGAGVSIPQISSLLGTIGTIGSVAGVGSIPFAGVFLGSGTAFNALLSSSDVRSLDAIQIRVGEKQIGTFRVGSRYPVTTSQYSSGISSTVASQLAGVTVNGQNVSSLLNSLATASVPVFQYEDLGLTLKATPQVQKSGNVVIHLDMKIEALAGGTINNIPILNSRQLTSDIIVPNGQTALLGSAVSTQESRAIQGIPLLNEIPGLGGTNRDVEHDHTDLLITVTPHIVRRRSPTVATRRVLANLAPTPE